MYFSQFPLYATSLTRNFSVVIQDFFTRIAVEERFTDVSSFLTPYLIQDGQRPEQVSDLFYGSPQYHWVVLYTNNIINVLQEWPMDSRYVIPHLYSHYDFTRYVHDASAYDVGDLIHTAQKGRLRVTSVTENYVTARSLDGHTIIENTTNLSIQKATTRSKGHRAWAITDPEETIHHYEHLDLGVQVDPDPSNPRIVPIDNATYEIRRNDEKRSIRLLEPRYLQQFVTNFQNLLNV